MHESTKPHDIHVLNMGKRHHARSFLIIKLNTPAYVISHLIAPGDGHVVEYPVVLVVHQHPLLQQGQPLHALPIPHTVALLAQHLVVKS